ncbi:hypothetical protein P171DRAFT_436164 [Karstenula rhodostoma CBS 690.94]|uniref:Uncharacterized protein n=1 Tax=Karstenula rhodostoma CBS 690.94 TaxID=1392251 RepID=A0A9P4PAA4_9PLEO|nr:hypothetical protein P171DRAFT_436164 [Karstenula rhodostoma CBS 690.94]
MPAIVELRVLAFVVRRCRVHPSSASRIPRFQERMSIHLTPSLHLVIRMPPGDWSGCVSYSYTPRALHPSPILASFASTSSSFQ